MFSVAGAEQSSAVFRNWIPDETQSCALRQPAIAIYSDFVMSDYAKTLPTVKIPLLVFAADSGVFPKGIAMGKALAGMAPRGTFVPIEDGGHMLFYEQSQKFNSTLAGFVKGLK